MSMDALYDLVPQQGANRIMLIMLPSAKARPQDLVQYGFVRAVRERSLPIDVVAVEADLGDYLERSFNEHLTHDIIAPARAARNYQQIWLMGISLGGMGSLIYAREHPADIEGVILLAPFLGTRKIIAEIVHAGGLACWQPGVIKPDDDERGLLAWIKAYQPAAATLPKIYLGYGTADRFAEASKLLAERLPAAQVVTTSGSHDWASWIHLWRHLLDQDLFSGDKKVARMHVTVSKDWPSNDVR
jgi:pimeloyl-ACP methyl ester carboxylesterase